MRYLFPYNPNFKHTAKRDMLVERLYGLQIKQALPLPDKIELSLARIKDFYEYFNGQVVISFSGGKDSLVLIDLVRSLYPDVEGVFVNTGLEFPEIVKLVKSTPNVTILRPLANFKTVIETHGWPVISKQVSEQIERYRRGNKYELTTFWHFLFDAPFKISPYCCHALKTGPIQKYKRENQKTFYVGTKALDSYRRRWAYANAGGCNIFTGNHQRSAPLSFWKDQDVLEYIREKKLPLASIYGDIVDTNESGLKTTKEYHTGCVYCCFGLHLETGKNRFERLASSHPKLHGYIMEKLGLKDVLRWLRENCPDKLSNKFNDGLKSQNRLF
jgi:3'-phosphoadenosine 5'-phosphosulfate sulfotransferase (PAPS reductase)/FAD synthetase